MWASVRATVFDFAGRRSGLLIVVGLLILLAAIGSVVSDRFRSLSNAQNVWEQSTALALASLGQTMVILAGGIDLSVGSLVSLASVLLSGLTNGDPGMVPFAIAAVIGVGILVGFANGGLAIWLGVHPLIVTLGMGAVLQGVTLLYSLGPAGSMPPGFAFLAYGRFLGMPLGALLTLVLFILVALFLKYVPFGRYVYAVGDDEVAAKLLGLPRVPLTLFVYAFSGLCAALAAIFLVARFGVGNAYIGQNYTLASITPVVVGGTMLGGGRGGVIGTLLGVYLISLLNNLLNFMDISSYYQLVVQGLVIILAVSLYVDRKRRG
jgi:ribose/xylose/arabinose/galactoside ABC-type transport system permease subunit